MQRKTLATFNFLCEIFRSLAFVFQRKSYLLEIKCLFILSIKHLVKKLSSEKGGGHLPEHGHLCSKLW